MLRRKIKQLESKDTPKKVEEQNEINVNQHIQLCMNLNETDNLNSDNEKTHFCYYKLEEHQKTEENLSKIKSHFSSKHEIKFNQHKNEKQSFIAKEVIDSIKEHEANIAYKEEIEAMLESSTKDMKGKILFQTIDKETFHTEAEKYSSITKKSINFCKYMIVKKSMWTKKEGNKWENMITKDIKNRDKFNHIHSKKMQNCTIFFCK